MNNKTSIIDKDTDVFLYYGFRTNEKHARLRNEGHTEVDTEPPNTLNAKVWNGSTWVEG